VTILQSRGRIPSYVPEAERQAVAAPCGMLSRYTDIPSAMGIRGGKAPIRGSSRARHPMPPPVTRRPGLAAVLLLSLASVGIVFRSWPGTNNIFSYSPSTTSARTSASQLLLEGSQYEIPRQAFVIWKSQNITSTARTVHEQWKAR